jgi:hypothetical protein
MGGDDLLGSDYRPVVVTSQDVVAVDVPTGSVALTTAAKDDVVEVERLVPAAGLSAAPRTAIATIMATVRAATPTRTQNSLRRLKPLGADTLPWTVA